MAGMEVFSDEKINKGIIVILGMHRSATSLTAELLSEMGGYAGEKDELLLAAECNPNGFYERKDVMELENQVLLENSMLWRTFRKSGRIKYSAQDKEKACFIVKRLGVENASNFILLKEPRMCLMEELWHDVFEMENLKEKIVVVFRHPDEVANSLNKRDGMGYEYALALWYFYNLNILKRLLSIEGEGIPVLYINHNKYFYNAKENISKLLDFIDLRSDWERYSHVIETNLYHNRAENKQENELYKKIISLYDYMLQLENGNVSLLKKDVEHFNSMWEDIYNIFCVEDDMKKEFVFSFRDTKLCCHELLHKRELMIAKFDEFFDANGIDEIFIYGNGMAASALYPVLAKTHIRVNKIFDEKADNEEVLIGDKYVCVEKYVRGSLSEKDIILNTVISRPQEIERLFPDKLGSEKYFLLSDLLCIFEN